MNVRILNAGRALKREWPTVIFAAIAGGVVGYFVKQYQLEKEQPGDEDDTIFVEETEPQSSTDNQYSERNYRLDEEPRFGNTVDLGKPSLEEVTVFVDHISYDKIIDEAGYSNTDIPEEEASSLGPKIYAEPESIVMAEGHYTIISRREMNDLSMQRELEELQYFPDAEILVSGENWATLINDNMQDVIVAFIEENPAADEVYLREDGTDDDALYHVLIRTGANYNEEVELHLDLMEIQDE